MRLGIASEWKQWEDSAILLASNRPHKKDQTKKQRKTEREKNRERLRTSGLTGSSPLASNSSSSFFTRQVLSTLFFDDNTFAAASREFPI
jgi:hypothetical protein